MDIRNFFNPKDLAKRPDFKRLVLEDGTLPILPPDKTYVSKKHFLLSGNKIYYLGRYANRGEHDKYSFYEIGSDYRIAISESLQESCQRMMNARQQYFGPRSTKYLYQFNNAEDALNAIDYGYI